MEYIPADRAVVPMTEGQPAPADGWFVPPAVMQEIIPCLDERYRSPERRDGEQGAIEDDGKAAGEANVAAPATH